MRESANFALKWQGAALDERTVEALLDAFEAAWQRYAGDWSQPVPPGADAYRINIFMSLPGESPVIDGDYGYALVDDAGYAYVVIGEDLLNDPDPEALPAVIAHEVYHCFQSRTTAFGDPASWWYWEASAEWASSEVHADSAYPYYFAGAYALKPELAIFHYSDPHTRPLLGTHHYGAMMFLRYLTERSGVPDLVARSWSVAEAGDDPLVLLDRLVPSHDVAQSFTEFAGRQVAWDLPERDQLLWSIDWYVDAYPNVDRIAARVDEAGTAGWVDLPAARAPRAFGLALVEIARPPVGGVRVAIEPSLVGSRGSAGELHAQVVSQTSNGVTYHPLPEERVLELAVPEATASVHLVVNVTAATRDPAEKFGFRYSVEAVELSDDKPDDADGPDDAEEPSDAEESATTGCSAAGAGGPGGTTILFFLAAIAVAWRLPRRSKKNSSSQGARPLPT